MVELGDATFGDLLLGGDFREPAGDLSEACAGVEFVGGDLVRVVAQRVSRGWSANARRFVIERQPVGAGGLGCELGGGVVEEVVDVAGVGGAVAAEVGGDVGDVTDVDDVHAVGPIGALLDPDAATVEFVEGAAGRTWFGAFSPDGDRIAVLSFDTGVQLFDVATREPIGVPMPLGTVNEQVGPGISWSDDGTGVWVVPPGGPVRFAADPTSWREIACEMVNRELTLDEWRAFVSPTSDPVPACDPV